MSCKSKPKTITAKDWPVRIGSKMAKNGRFQGTKSESLVFLVKDALVKCSRVKLKVLLAEHGKACSHAEGPHPSAWLSDTIFL